MAAGQAFLRHHARHFLLAAIAAVMWGLWFGLFLRTMTPRPFVTLRPEPPTDDCRIEFSREADKLVAFPFGPQIHVNWATPSQRGPVQVWSIPSGRPLCRLLGPEDGVWWAELSPDGDRVAVLHGALKLTVVKVSTNETFTVDCFKDWTTAFDTWPGYCCFSGDGHLLACGAYSRKNGRLVVLWDIDGRREVYRLEGHAGPLAFSRDGKLLATHRPRDGGSWDTSTVLWDTATAMQKASFLFRADSITRIVFSRDGRHLAVGGEPVGGPSSDLDVAIWDLETGQLAGSFLGLKGVEALGDELQVSARSVERPLASEPHSRRLPADPYFELLSAFPRREGASPHGRWRIEEQHRESWLDDFWEFAGGLLEDVPKQGRDSGQLVVRDALTDEAVVTLQRTGHYRLSPDACRLAMVSEEGIHIWDLPPRRPLGLLLALAAVPTLLFTGLVWLRLGRVPREG